MKKLIYLFVTMILFVTVLANPVAAGPQCVKKWVKNGDLQKLEEYITTGGHQSLNVMNKHGKTPLDLAQESHNEEIITLLKNNGAKNAIDLSDEEKKLSLKWTKIMQEMQEMGEMGELPPLLQKEIPQLSPGLQIILHLGLSNVPFSDSAE